MLEQSKLNNPIYVSIVEDGKLATKKATIPDIQFGKPYKLRIHKNPLVDKFLIEDIENENAYIYSKVFLEEVNPQTHPQDQLLDYFCGIANYEGREHIYWIKNQPPITETLPQVDLKKLELPVSLTGYPYEQTFQYDEQLLNLIGHLPAAYVDRYKRPLNPSTLPKGLYLPMGIDKTNKTFKELATNECHFPIVVNLKNSNFAIVDLEPGYEDSESQEAETFPYIYKETTPRGGIHYLIRTETDGFKYQVSKHLEIITNTMVTFYGSGKHYDTEQVITKDDLAKYQEIGRTKIKTIKTNKDYSEIINRLETRNETSLGLKMVEEQYKIEDDESKADYFSLKHLLLHNIAPYLNNLYELGYDDHDIPWIMAQYLQRHIEYRLKHDRELQGVPYLVYVATQVYTKWLNK